VPLIEPNSAKITCKNRSRKRQTEKSTIMQRSFIRQIADDATVCLEPAQDKGGCEGLKPFFGLRAAMFPDRGGKEALEPGFGAQKSWVEEIYQRQRSPR